MKKNAVIGLFIILLFSCSQKKAETNKSEEIITSNFVVEQQNDFPSKDSPNSDTENVVVEEQVDIPSKGPINYEEIKRLSLLHFNDENVIARNKVEYYPETDVIKNIENFDQKESFYDYFRKPFSNIELNAYQNNRMKLKELLAQFNIIGYDLSSLNSVNMYTTIKIPRDGINLYLTNVGSDTYRIFVIEIVNDSDEYKSSLSLNSSQEDIIELLGEPNFYTDDNSNFIFSSLNDLHQLNISFENNKIEKLQYIVWEDI